MVSLHFNCRDIIRSTRLAFSFQRLWIQFVGLLLGYLVYVILTYVSLVLGGQNAGMIWSRLGLLPGIIGVGLPWYSLAVYGLGVLALVYAWFVTATGVARATYMHLKGNAFYSWKEAMAFALKKKGGAVISTPVAILAIAFFTVLGGYVVGLLGRIPYVGEIGLSVFSIIWYIASLFLVFVLAALAVSIILTPAVLATTDDDAFEGIFQSFSMLFSQPWRLIFYELLLIILAVLGFGVFAFVAKKAWIVMNSVIAVGMGEKYITLSYAASGMLERWVYPAVVWSNSVLGDYAGYIFFSQQFANIALSPATMTISAYIFAVCLSLIGGYIMCYPLAIFNAGNSVIFMILKKIKDDENLLDRKDREEEEDMEDEYAEPVAQPAVPNKPAAKKPAARKKSSKK